MSKQFAANLRRIRERRGLTQTTLAALIDRHRTEISLLERGGREPRLGLLIKLASSLEVQPSELMEGIEWQPSSGRPPKPAFRKAQLPPDLCGGFRVAGEEDPEDGANHDR